MAQLAEEIAAAVNPSIPVTLEVRNISSLDASSAGFVRLHLENELRRHSFQLASAGSAAARATIPLRFTLSESADAYIWVVELPKRSQDEISAPDIIVSAPKTTIATDGSASESLSLETRFVWKQPDKFLDFALIKDSTSGEPRLLVLGTDRMALYKSSDSQWQLSGTTTIPQNASTSRDPYGTINAREGYASVADLKCLGEPDLTGVVRCIAFEPPKVLILRSGIPGLPSSLGTTVPGGCRGEIISLYTGPGDWTQSDSIQGYLMKGLAQPMVPSGGAIQFEGPVMYLQPEPDMSAARAIVHNLKTGNYEAYIVTATCNH